jgi:hypothetical protein
MFYKQHFDTFHSHALACDALAAMQGRAAGAGLAKGEAGGAGDEGRGARPDAAAANGEPRMNARAKRRALRAARFGPPFTAVPQGAAGTSAAEMAAPARATQGCPLAAAPQGGPLRTAAQAPKGVAGVLRMVESAWPAETAREGLGGLAAEAVAGLIEGFMCVRWREASGMRRAARRGQRGRGIVRRGIVRPRVRRGIVRPRVFARAMGRTVLSRVGRR